MSIENCAADQENDSDVAISFIRLLLTNDGNALRKGAAMDFFMNVVLNDFASPCPAREALPARALAKGAARCKAKLLSSATDPGNGFIENTSLH